jgi:hypothetical protein
MGILNRNKESNESKWSINKKPGNIELNDKHITITIKLINIEHIIFYKDIIGLKKGKKCIRISSRIDSYTISSNPDIVDKTYNEIFEKVSQYK